MGKREDPRPSDRHHLFTVMKIKKEQEKKKKKAPAGLSHLSVPPLISAQVVLLTVHGIEPRVQLHGGQYRARLGFPASLSRRAMLDLICETSREGAKWTIGHVDLELQEEVCAECHVGGAVGRGTCPHEVHVLAKEQWRRTADR